MGTVRFFRHSTQFFQHYIPTEFVILGFVEFLCMLAAFHLAVEIRFLGEIPTDFVEINSKALVFSVTLLLSLVALGAYQRHSIQSVEFLALRIGSSLLFGLVPLGLSYYFFPQFFFGRGGLALSILFSFILIMIVRLVFRRVQRSHDMRLRVLVLGSGETANLVREAEVANELEGLNVVGYMPMPGDREHGPEEKRLTPQNSVIEFVEKNRIDEIVLAADDRRQGLPVQDLLDCKMSGVEISDLLTFFERETGEIRLDILNPSWLYLSDGFRESTFRRISKRMFDLSVALLMLPVALPFMVLSAIAIFVESGFRGPVLYSQVRICEDGRPFKIYKFRSMRTDAEQDGVARWAQKNDSRITSVGHVIRKTRLDELPQLFNVLKGDMSFVGPRPERPEFVDTLAEKIPYYHERHRVKPGLTGWAQIRYQYGDCEEDGLKKLQYDLYYVKNYSIFIDLLILLQTAEVVLLGKGAH